MLPAVVNTFTDGTTVFELSKAWPTKVRHEPDSMLNPPGTPAIDDRAQPDKEEACIGVLVVPSHHDFGTRIGWYTSKAWMTLQNVGNNAKYNRTVGMFYPL